MGVTFIGNPFDQETEYDDSDWEMNAVEDWIMPPQEVAFADDVERAPINIILAPDDDSSDSLADQYSDEEYNPEDDDNYDFNDEAEFDSYFDSNEDDDDEEIDYVTYPLSEPDISELDKPTITDTINTGESSDTD